MPLYCLCMSGFKQNPDMHEIHYIWDYAFCSGFIGC